MTTVFNLESDRCECSVLRDFKAGDQVLMFYGPRSNGDMFLHNGFVYPENAHDYYQLRLGLSKSDPLLSRKAAILEKLELSEQLNVSLPKAPTELDVNILLFVKIFLANEDLIKELEKYSMKKDIMKLIKSSELENEAAVLKFLLARLKLMLVAYPTKLADDIEHLKDASLSKNTRIIIQLRIAEKSILNEHINLLETRLATS